VNSPTGLIDSRTQTEIDPGAPYQLLFPAKGGNMRIHRIDKYRPEYQDASLGNGLIGIRVGANPLQAGRAVINGYNGYEVDQGGEGYGAAPFPSAATSSFPDVRCRTDPISSSFDTSSMISHAGN